MADDVRWLTYSEIAEALEIGADSARNLVRRKRWPRQTGNDGLARIGVPVEHLKERKAAEGDGDTDGPTDPPVDGDTNPPSDAPTSPTTDGTLVALEVLREHIGRLEIEITSLKEERDRERARASQVDALNTVLDIERKRAEDARQRADELKAERDRWSAAAEAFQEQVVEMSRKPKGLLGWLRRA